MGFIVAVAVESVITVCSVDVRVKWVDTVKVDRVVNGGTFVDIG